MTLEVRISDKDREAAIERLGEAAGEGRLTAEEHEQRADAVLAARTQSDLDALFEDLPPAKARHRGRRRDGFPEHLRAYVLVNLLLIGIWAATGFGYFWPIWPIMGWGVGLLSHMGGATACTTRSSAGRRAASSTH